jgi:hypothetical protein
MSVQVNAQIDNLLQVLQTLVNGAASVSTTSASATIDVPATLANLLSELGLDLSGNVSIAGAGSSSGTSSSTPAQGSGTTTASGNVNSTGNVLGVVGSLVGSGSVTASGSKSNADSAGAIKLSNATVSLLTSLGLNVSSAS